jgi:hypothetical protein
MVDRLMHRRIHLSRLSQKVGPPLTSRVPTFLPRQPIRSSTVYDEAAEHEEELDQVDAMPP